MRDPGRWDEMLSLVERTKGQARESKDRRCLESTFQSATKTLKVAKKAYARAGNSQERLKLGATL